MPLLIVGVCFHRFHIVDFSTQHFQSFFPKTKPESEKKKTTPKTPNKPPLPHVEITLLEVIPQSISYPSTQRKEVHFFPRSTPPEEGFVLGSSPPPAWTQLHPGMAFGIREQILLALHLPSATLLKPHLLDQIYFVFFTKKKRKKRHFVRTLCVKMYHSPDQLTVRVLCICSTAQCKLVNTSLFLLSVCLFFFLYLFFLNQGFV